MVRLNEMTVAAASQRKNTLYSFSGENVYNNWAVSDVFGGLPTSRKTAQIPTGRHAKEKNRTPTRCLSVIFIGLT